MTAVRMGKVPPDLHHLTETDHLASVRHLRVQVVTNSKGYVELNLNNRGLRIVPPETFQLTNTQVLRLAQNYIDYLPTMIAYLRGLRVLDLQRNVLVHLPETLVNCKHLAELRLTGNRLASLPRTFGGLKNLRILELGQNQLEQLPHEIGLLHSLRTLDLHSNRLWHLPFSLTDLRHLLNLNLSDNMFDHVPLVVTKVTSIRALNLSRNRLGSLPLGLDALKGLRELNLSHNKMASISSILVTLTHLKYLSLAHNGLKFLPSRLSQLQNLRVLHLQGNELRHVPSCLRRLRFYNVSSNKLEAFSVEGMRALVSITASKNRLQTIPRGLYKLKQLKFLSLDGNALVEIGEEVGNLKQLKVVNLAHNNLHGLPQAFHRLPLLQSFNIKGNYSLNKRKSERSKSGGKKMDNEKYKEYTKTMKDSARKNLMSRKGAFEFEEDDREDENDNGDDDDDDDDDDEDDVDNEEDDYDNDDEGVWMGGGGIKSNDASARNGDGGYHGNTRGGDGRGYYDNTRRGVGGGALLSRSAKSLEELNGGSRREWNGMSHHRVAGELAGRSVEGKRRNVAIGVGRNDNSNNNSARRTERSHQKPSKIFVGRGVALPTSKEQTTLKRMTSSNFANQSSNRKPVRSNKNNNNNNNKNKSGKPLVKDRKGEKNKSRMFNKSVKNLRDLIFGTKSKGKSDEEIRTRGYVGDTRQMKTSNSVNLPLEYTTDEVNGDWKEPEGSRTSFEMHSGRNGNAMTRSVGEEGRDKDGGGFSRRRGKGTVTTALTHAHVPSESDVIDWKSVSHGYGSWRSRTRMLWEIERNSLSQSNQTDVTIRDVDDETGTRIQRQGEGEITDEMGVDSAVTRGGVTGTDCIDTNNNNNRTRRSKKRFESSDTVASDFTYQKFGGKPDRAPSRQSSNASRYLVEKRNNVNNNNNHINNNNINNNNPRHVASGNDRYSVVSGRGSMPRPSSRSKYLGQWFGPDYESSFTVGSDEEPESRSRSRDYSVREARASFATDTTVGTHSNKYTSRPAQHRRHDDYYNTTRYSNPGDNFSSKYHYRPTAHGSINDDVIHPTPRRDSLAPKHSSTNSLHNPTDDFNLTHREHDPRHSFTGSQEFPPFHTGRHYPRFNSNWLSRDTRPGRDQPLTSHATSHSFNPSRHVSSPRDVTKMADNNLEAVGYTRQTGSSLKSNERRSHDNMKHSNQTGPDQDQNGQQFSRSKSLQEFDNVLKTNEIDSDRYSQNTNQIIPPEMAARNAAPIKPKAGYKSDNNAINHLDDNFALRKKSEIPRSKSMNSLHDLIGQDGKLAPFGRDLNRLPAGYGTLARGASMKRPSKSGHQLNRTDYTLLGVCNQIETMLNKNLLQPVIGFKASHRFEDKTILENSEGIWRMGDSFDRNNDDNNDDDNDDDDDNKDNDDGRHLGKLGSPNVLETTLEYSQPQTFKVTSTGGQFVTYENPGVKVTVPAHSVSKSLQVTVQILNIPSSLLNRAKHLNHFIDNIVATGPVVYFYLTDDRKLNSPVSFQLPAPPSAKGSHLSVVSVRRDNSCMPCNTGFRSSKLEVSVSAWHFTAKVAMLTKAKCKYKACKSMEMLLQCMGANQV